MDITDIIKTNDNEIVNNENHDLCANCGGKCCMIMGCHISPDEIGDVTKEKIQELLDTEYVAIDWWVGDPRKSDDYDYKGYFLRMRNINEPSVHGSYGGCCKALTKTGCMLDFKHRPKGGRLLIPNEITGCHSEYTKQQCAIDWIKYHDVLKEVAEENYPDDDMSSDTYILDLIGSGLFDLGNFKND